MSSKNDEIKARLLEDFEALIDKMLEEKPPDNEILLSDIERAAIEVGEQAKRQIAQRLGGKIKADAVICPDCGERVPIKDYRDKQVVTKAGEITIRRAYHYCKTCRKGFFPPG